MLLEPKKTYKEGEAARIVAKERMVAVRAWKKDEDRETDRKIMSSIRVRKTGEENEVKRS